MPLYFRRSRTFGPFRLTVSKRGLSTSLGAKGLRLTSGPNGVRATASKYGLRYTERLDKPSHSKRGRTPARPAFPKRPQTITPTAAAALAPPLPTAPPVALPGWYKDPLATAPQRFWDGHTWTERVRT